MKLSDLQDSWSEDCKINEMELGKESARTPNLHAKYLNYLSSTRINLRKAESDYYNIRRLKYRYYRGELTQAELEENNWEQYQGNKPLKNEMDEFLICDVDLLKLQDKVEYFKTVLYQLEQIIRSLNSRTWDIKNCIEWNKFTNGMM
jgi:Recombination, repair and ssDNA binding protein UvsY